MQERSQTISIQWDKLSQHKQAGNHHTNQEIISTLSAPPSHYSTLLHRGNLYLDFTAEINFAWCWTLYKWNHMVDILSCLAFSLKFWWDSPMLLSLAIFHSLHCYILFYDLQWVVYPFYCDKHLGCFLSWAIITKSIMYILI